MKMKIQMFTFRGLVAAVIVHFATLSSSAQELFIYNNTVNGLGQAFLNGGAANQSGNTITRLVADDITPIAGFAGQPIENIYFAVANLNGVAVSTRPRLRLWNADGAAGAPGTLISGFSFNPISFSPGIITELFFHPAGLNVPTGTFWMGLTFDDNNGGTGALAAQLDNLGLAYFAPPTVGTSADTAFETTVAGSFLVSNPAGSLFNNGGNPPADFLFGLSVNVIPEPGTVLAGLCVAGVAAFSRFPRRRTSQV